MARRPDDTRGALIFQEGKCIEGDFYIVAVYDDPASCTYSFAAYELENDCTFTYPLTYSEFDALFKFDSELMNPSNHDGRFHWVIERLDFVQDNQGRKVLCLAQEPTPDVDEDEDVEEQQKTKTKGFSVAAAGGGKVDAVTRAKLLKELDTQDDQKLQAGLVKSEGARRRFLADLHAKRQLEQLKASQRLLKADEEREERLKKLDVIKQQQKAKAEQHRLNEEAKKSTKAQLDVLMKQKEAQAIRKLIQEKDEQDRGLGREKDAARQRRKMQERSSQEIKAIEDAQAKQLARKRDEQVIKREALITRRNHQIAEVVHKERQEIREDEARLKEAKDAMIARLWAEKREARREKERKKNQFTATEEVRDRVNLDQESARAMRERERVMKKRTEEAADKEENDNRKLSTHKAFLLQWKVDASNRKMQVREQEKRNAKRQVKIDAKEDLRLRRFRESHFLGTQRGGNRTMLPSQTGPTSPGGNNEMGDTQYTAEGVPITEETEAFQKTYEQQERQKRHEQRELKRKAEEAKSQKLQQLGGKDPNLAEIMRIREWQKEAEAKKTAAEKKQVAAELAQEEEMRASQERVANRQALWEKLEASRREKNAEAEARRNEEAIARVRQARIGAALPSVFVC
jgi:hypothetical protein